MDNIMISDIEAEAGVIATLVYHPDFILHSDYLKPGYFSSYENGCIYWAIQELYKAGVENIDAINITNMLHSNKRVMNQMITGNITDIQKFIAMAEVAARHTLEEYKLLVNSVVENSFKRELVALTGEIRSKCFDGNTNLSKLNQFVYSKLNNLTEKYITGEEIKTLGEQIDGIWDSLENEDITKRLPSKFPSFNDYFYYEPGELVLISARMKSGKSCFAMNEAIHKLQSNVPTLYIDTEMSTTLFTKRLISNITGIPFRVIQNKTYTEEQRGKILKCIEWVHTLPFVHIYLPASTMDEIYSICKILKYKMNLQFVVYDYIKSYNSEAYTNSALLGQMADFLKNNIAGELELAVLAGAQLGRNDQISNSDLIARAISTGIYWRFKTAEEIQRDGGLKAGNIMAYINFNRNGAQTDEDEAIFFDFNGDIQRITEAKIQKKDLQSMPFDSELPQTIKV